MVNRPAALTVGDVRNLGFRHVVERLGAVAERMWLLSTDADTIVPSRPGCSTTCATPRPGAIAVAGAVDLDDPHLLPADALARYTAPRRAPGSRAAPTGTPTPPTSACAADAFQRVGGFPGVIAGEEHALLVRLRHAGPARAVADRRAGPHQRPHATGGPAAASPTCCAR